MEHSVAPNPKHPDFLKVGRKFYLQTLTHTTKADKAAIIDSVKAYLPYAERFKGKKILDLGANIGSASRIFLDYGAKTVISVEPLRENAEKLRENAPKAVHVIAAVGKNRIKEISLYGSGKEEWRGIGASTIQRGNKKEVEKVFQTPLSTLLKEKPDIIKCDIEGSEHDIIDEIIEYAPEMLFIEVHETRKIWEGKTKEYLKSLKQIYNTIVIEPTTYFGKEICQNLTCYNV